MERSQAWTAHRDERTGDLLDAALEVIRVKGPATSIDDVALKVGVTRPVIYRYFGSRDGLARAVSERTVQQVKALMLPDELAGDGRAMVERAIDGYLRFLEDEPALYGYLVRGPLGRGSDANVRVPTFADQLGREVASRLHDVLAADGRATGPAEAWAFGLVGLLHTSGEWWVERGTLSRKRLVQYLTEMVWEGMSSSPKEKTNDCD